MASVIGSAAAQTAIIPPLAGASPRLRFHLGEMADNMPLISPALPNMPAYPPSSWYVSQWNQASYIQPTSLQSHNPTTYDPRLGAAAFAFQAPDGHAHVWVYPYQGSWAYDLYEAGGTLRSAGGSNLFLSSDQLNVVSLAQPITLDFDAKLSKAGVYASAQARASGAVLSQVFVGFVLRFTDPQTGNPQSVFMQIPISGSYPLSRNAKFFCKGSTVSLFTPNLTHNEVLLPYTTDDGPLRHFHYTINPYLDDLLSTTACGASWPVSASKSDNWSVIGFYIGLETEVADDRAVSNAPPQGVVETGFQIANLVLAAQTGTAAAPASVSWPGHSGAPIHHPRPD